MACNLNIALALTIEADDPILRGMAGSDRLRYLGRMKPRTATPAHILGLDPASGACFYGVRPYQRTGYLVQRRSGRRGPRVRYRDARGLDLHTLRGVPEWLLSAGTVRVVTH